MSETMMSAYRSSGWRKQLSVSALILFGCALAASGAMAQTRTQLTLADVPVYVPAPYHPHSVTAINSPSLYDAPASSAATSDSNGTHSWH
jgi:hypothetical protein